jgi:hypothetical protein
LVNPFTAEVAIMRLLGWAEVACVRPEKEEQSDWLVWPNDSFHWPGVFILQTDAKSIQCFKKTHAKLIENRFRRSKVQLTRVWELLTRCWNAWHWESHCVFTAGGERVKVNKTRFVSCVDIQNICARTHTRTHAHTHTHTLTHTYTYTNKQSRTHVHTHTLSYWHTHTHTHILWVASIHDNSCSMLVCVSVCVHVCVCVRACVCVCVCAPVFVRVFMFVCMCV